FVREFPASLGGFTVGVSLGWNSTAGEVFRNYLDASSLEIGLIGGLLNAGACVGAILTPFFFGRFSRTPKMPAFGAVLAVGWCLIVFANDKILLMIGRVICGLPAGVFCVLMPIYIAEIADEKIRGRLLSFFQIFINLGVMYVFVAAYMEEKHSTVSTYSLACGMPCVLLIMSTRLSNSPYYYLSRNDEINAIVSLKWFHGIDYDAQRKINEIKRLILMVQPKKLIPTMIKNRRVLRSFATCLGVVLSQHLSGANMMIFYALTLFNTIGSGELTGSEQTLLVGAVQILASLLAALLVDVLGRRILLALSTSLMGLFLILLGWFFGLRDKDPEYDDIYFWMPPAWIILFFAAFNLGLGPISWSVLGDTLPVEVKVPVASVVVSLGWLVSLLSALTFDEMIISLGATKAMWLCAGICWLSTLFCAIVVKDTTGKSLTEVQEEFFDTEPNRTDVQQET
ncbi:Facilitated trehalose transporter Tret1, partial [Dufourea novaeangliae]